MRCILMEQDSHYNNSLSYNPISAQQNNAGGDAGLTTPLPEFEEGPAAFPGNETQMPEGGTQGGGRPEPNRPGMGRPEPNRPGMGRPEPNRPGMGRPEPNRPGGGIQIPVFPIFPTQPSMPQQSFGQVRFLNASVNSGTVNISIDGNAYAINSRFGTVSNYDWISDGFHTVTIRRASGLRSILLQQNFPFVAGQKVTMVLTDSAFGGLELVRVVDTGCRNLPNNSGCYRFANMSYSGSGFDLLLYGGETIFRNVGFQTVTPYKQAIAGNYQMYVTSSNTYTFLTELPIIMIGAIGTNANMAQPLLSFTAEINAGQNYTTYLIGNTWSDVGLRAMTLED